MKKIVIILTLIAVLAITYFYINQNIVNLSNNHLLPKNFKIGLVNNCRKIPKFIRSLKMRQPAIDSKQQGHSGGLLIRDVSNNSVWQHESWLQSGYIGAFDRDARGNTYVAPLPYVSLSKNPPELQNQIYIINNDNAEMSLFKKLPTANKPNSKNPFGAMGLTFDCDTNSLYVSSVAGSKPLQENGSIYQIDINNGEIISQYINTDSIGVGIFNTLKGKRLYYGSARNPYIYSVLLDEEGHFNGGKRYEFSLAEIQGGDTTVAKKIQFKKIANKFQMIIKETEFGFRLLAENNLNRKKYIFNYSLSKDKWTFSHASND